MNYFESELPPFESIDTKRLPIRPIVVIDMPYVQATVGQKQADRLPRWHNPDEVSAIIEVLEVVRARAGKKPPSIVVLSPYTQQVNRLNRAIDDASSTRLAHLSEFSFAHKFGGMCGTVDSFQGNEADFVIVSLVRNNQHISPRGALGFLSDFRRMNVLLSRARWQLVLVGSIRFLETIVEAAKGSDDAADLAFLRIMLETLSKWKADRVIEEVPFARLSGTAK